MVAGLVFDWCCVVVGRGYLDLDVSFLSFFDIFDI
jgi:hypothetical protein